MDRFENKWVVSRRILFPSDLNLTKITKKVSENFVSFRRNKINRSKGLDPHFSHSRITNGSAVRFFCSFFFRYLYFTYHSNVIRNREFLSKKVRSSCWDDGINCYLIWYIVFSNVGELRETEREGFEPSVNKSLHSSSNATPWTTRPSFLHNLIIDQKPSE